MDDASLLFFSTVPRRGFAATNSRLSEDDQHNQCSQQDTDQDPTVVNRRMPRPTELSLLKKLTYVVHLVGWHKDFDQSQCEWRFLTGPG